jgi:hypothetical protein
MSAGSFVAAVVTEALTLALAFTLAVAAVLGAVFYHGLKE